MSKIMIVEDDASLREIYSVRITSEGYDVVSAGDGEEALAVAVREKPDLILSDVMMPKISGFDMLDILRSTPETANIKVIMMTALSAEDQKDRGERLGADRYLVKSQVGIDDVVKVIHEVMGDAVSSEAATPSTPEATAAPATPDATDAPEVAPFTPVTITPPSADAESLVSPSATVSASPESAPVAPAETPAMAEAPATSETTPTPTAPETTTAPAEPETSPAAPVPEPASAAPAPEPTPVAPVEPAPAAAPAEPAPTTPPQVDNGPDQAQ
ncbi:response regulator [Candidatus Saccharibacteria bacterium]|nr:response regulator [Candidatus Saccharibacteria bacterium]